MRVFGPYIFKVDDKMRRENFLSGPNFMYLIGHFQITFGLFFKASPGAHSFI